MEKKIYFDDSRDDYMLFNQDNIILKYYNYPLVIHLKLMYYLIEK